jgi:TldD protein
MNAKAQTLLAQARKTLLTPYGLDVADLTPVFGKIMAHQVDYADLYFQYSRSEAWSLEEGIVKAGSFSIDEGVGVRALSGEKTAFAYSDDISARRSAMRPRRCGRLPRPGRSGGVPALKKATADIASTCRTIRWLRSTRPARSSCSNGWKHWHVPRTRG